MVIVTGLRWTGMASAFEGSSGSRSRRWLVVGSNVTGGDVVSMKILKNGGET